MRKWIILIFLAISYLSESPVEALSWNSEFVVWDDRVYEIKEEIIEPHEIGKYIGKVDAEADDYTGDYDGNASNIYPIGTKYYEIKNLSSDHAIAVEFSKQQWKKAEFIHDAPFRMSDLTGKYLPYTFLAVMLFIIFIFFLRRQNARR